jgi:hypothetical protein
MNRYIVRVDIPELPTLTHIKVTANSEEEAEKVIHEYLKIKLTPKEIDVMVKSYQIKEIHDGQT